MKFSEVVKTERTSCKVCFSILYTLPCQVDRDIPGYLKGFGEPLYPLKSVKLLRIDGKDGYKIESKVGKNLIKFAIPKTLENSNLNENERKIEFEKCLADWMTNKLDITITVE